MSPEQKNAVKEIVTLFDSAEDKVKEVEQLAQELSVPSINELRYVGYHLARAFCEEDPQELNIQITKAKGHCKRAIYDAHEIGIIFMLEQIKLFKEEYSQFSSSVIEVLPSYTQELATASKASRFIAEVKEKHRNNRDTYYKKCEPHYLSLRDIFDKLTIAEPLINQNISEKSENDRKNTRRFVTTTLLSSLGIAISLTIGAIVIYLKLNTAS